MRFCLSLGPVLDIHLRHEKRQSPYPMLGCEMTACLIKGPPGCYNLFCMSTEARDASALMGKSRSAGVADVNCQKWIWKRES